MPVGGFLFVFNLFRICNQKSNFISTKQESQVMCYFVVCPVVGKKGYLLMHQNVSNRVH